MWNCQNRRAVAANQIREAIGKKLPTPGVTRWNSYDSCAALLQVLIRGISWTLAAWTLGPSSLCSQWHFDPIGTSTVTFCPCDTMTSWVFWPNQNIQVFFVRPRVFWLIVTCYKTSIFFTWNVTYGLLWRFVLCFLILSMCTFCYIFFSLFALWHYVSFSRML